MKKFFTLLIVLVSVAVQMEASDQNIYLRTNLVEGGWGGSNSALKFVYKGANPSNANEDVYTFSINSGNIISGDIYFRLWVNGWDYEFAPNCYYHNHDYQFLFTNGQYDSYDVKVHWTEYKNQGKPDGWSENSQNRAFKIPQSSINASEYLITLYCKNTYNSGDNINIKVDIVSMPVSVGAKGYATYCNADRALNFDFTGNRIKAYTVGSTNGSALTLTQVNRIAKNTPVLLYSTTNSDSQNIPVISTEESTDDVTGNMLVAGDGVAHTWTGEAKHYILYTGGDNPGFYKANNSTVAIGKAYLDLTGVSASREFFAFPDDETTGINGVENGNVEAKATVIYNMNGQRVANPTKGLYIVNGKKVIIK